MTTLVTLEFDARIPASPEEVFDRLADLGHYDRWLPSSAAFGGLEALSESPVRAGTTYRDRGPAATWQGRVTACERPERLTFVQTTALRLGILPARMAIEIEYRLRASSGGGSALRRHYALRGPWYLWPARARLREQTLPENLRILELLERSFGP
ncbi:MAG: SRPBCC family protein [Myxococcales bacterium]|nr:SRPBCC family protein [Myxococcales bacterium]